MDKNMLAQVDAEFEERYDGRVWLDGVIDEAGWLAAKPKILWILKEPHDAGAPGRPVDAENALRGWMRAGLEQEIVKRPLRGWRRTFWPPLLISYALLNGVRDYQIVLRAGEKEIARTIHSIAWINIKKTGGGKSANPTEIRGYYNDYKDLLARQIEAIAPEIIFNCTRLSYPPLPLGRDLDERKIRHQARVVHLGHPARKGYQAYFEKAVTQILA